MSFVRSVNLWVVFTMILTRIMMKTCEALPNLSPPLSYPAQYRRYVLDCPLLGGLEGRDKDGASKLPPPSIQTLYAGTKFNYHPSRVNFDTLHPSPPLLVTSQLLYIINKKHPNKPSSITNTSKVLTNLHLT
jgi:hypothetical protein